MSSVPGLSAISLHKPLSLLQTPFHVLFGFETHRHNKTLEVSNTIILVSIGQESVCTLVDAQGLLQDINSLSWERLSSYFTVWLLVGFGFLRCEPLH